MKPRGRFTAAACCLSLSRGDQDLEFGSIDNQAVDQGPKPCYVDGAEMSLEIREAAPFFVDEKVTRLLRVLVKLEDLASRLIECLGPRAIKGGFDRLPAGLPHRESGQQRKRAGRVLKPCREGL